MRTVLLGILLNTALTWCMPTDQTPVRFDEHKLLKVLHYAESDLLKLLDMELKYELDFWKLPRHVNDSTYVRVPPAYLPEFMRELQEINAQVSTIVDNIQTILDQTPKKVQVSHRRSTFDLYNYHTYTSIQSFLQYVSTSSRQGVSVSTFNIGNSVENRPIEGVKISIPSSIKRKSIVIDGGIHAREWIAPAAVIYAIDQLTHNDQSSRFYNDVNWLISHYDVYLLPVINPDGYEYTDVAFADGHGHGDGQQKAEKARGLSQHIHL